MGEVLRLEVGRPAPRQPTATTCGPTVLAVARMVRDPALFAWIRDGWPAPADLRTLPSRGGPQERFAAYVQHLHRRVTGWTTYSGGMALAWPRALGAPPWGVADALEVAGGERARYRTVPVRFHDEAAMSRVLGQARDHLRADRPAALYVGNTWTPRHVTLLVPGDSGLLLYDPGPGTVTVLDVDALARRELPVGGWLQPWLVVGPVG